MSKEIKKATNYLIALLDNCWDGDLVDEVCMRVSSNDPFEEIDDGVTAQKHGRWEEYQIPHIVCCSECDWGTGVDDQRDECPNCGALMDGD